MADGTASRTWSPAWPGIRPWTVRVVDPEAGVSGDTVPYDDQDDASLVAASLAGHTAAFDVIVTRHRRTVYQVCYRFVGNHEDASDLSQEAFVRAWRGLKRFR